MTPEQFAAQAEKLQWYHRFRVGNYTTPGLVDPNQLAERIQLPESLDGLAVIDFGSADGGLAFVAEERGASPVVACDTFRYPHYGVRPDQCDQRTFNLVKEAFGSSVQPLHANVDRLLWEERFESHKGKYDLVLFCGLLYHLEAPLVGLRVAAAACKPGGRVVVETHCCRDAPELFAEFYPGRTLADDPSNWWGPTPACVVAMMDQAGFTSIQHVGTIPASYRVVSDDQIGTGFRGVWHAVKG